MQPAPLLSKTWEEECNQHPFSLAWASVVGPCAMLQKKQTQTSGNPLNAHAKSQSSLESLFQEIAPPQFNNKRTARFQTFSMNSVPPRDWIPLGEV